MDPLAEQFPAWNPYHYVHNNPINLVDPTGMSAEGTRGPNGAPPGEIAAKKGTTNYLKKGENGEGVQVLAPDGKYHSFSSKVKNYTYSDGKLTNGQQKKEGVWSLSNKEGNFLWNNVKEEYVLNTSDREAGENVFPSIGKMGTTYAGGENPRSKDGTRDDYSQPPQNIADYMGYIHDKEYDLKDLRGIEGVFSNLSTTANKRLIYFSNQVIYMYKKGKIDPFTGAPVSKLTHDTAVYMSGSFQLIESIKQK